MVSFISSFGSAVGAWMNDEAPLIGSSQSVELEVNEFELDLADHEKGTDQQDQTLSISMVDDFTAVIVAQVRENQIDGLIELDLHDGSLSIDTEQQFSSGEWVRLTTKNLQIYPFVI